MLYLRDFQGTERYRKALYFIFSDFEDNIITEEELFISKISPILLWEDKKDGGVFVKLAIYSTMPKGYKFLKDEPKAPYGYEWIYNGKFKKEGRCIGLLRIKK